MNEDNKKARVRVVHNISYLERHRRRYVNEHLKDTGLKGSMFLALLNLDHHPGSSQDDLVNGLLIDKGNVARLCRSLEDMGLITRQESPVDRRQNLLYLTAEGSRYVDRIRALVLEWREQAMRGLSEQERETVGRILEKMIDNVSQL